MQKLNIGNLTIDVVYRDIKNIHLSVYPPKGRVKISAPKRINMEDLRIYAISKLNWIRKQQKKFENQEREAPREYLNRESHYYRGKRYLLKVIEGNTNQRVELKRNKISIYVRPEARQEKRKELLEEWYREKLKEIIPLLIKKWEKKMKVKVEDFGVKKMRTKWGSCNREAKRIWLNLELAKKPPGCLEYIVVHEMAHLIERNHNDKFISLMNRFMPDWRHQKEELNRLPVSHVDWNY